MKPTLLAIATALCTSCSPAQVDVDGPPISPFRGMRRIDAGIEVQLQDDTWYELEAVAGVDTSTLLREADRLCGDRAWKRITEDLPALLDAMGHEVGARVDVAVRELTTGRRRTFAAVEMTRDNRRRLRDANRGDRDGWPGARGPAVLPPTAVAADLERLRELLDTRFAYRELRSVDLDARLRAARAALGDGPVARAEFVRAVDEVLRAFGDGHSRVTERVSERGPWLPFLVQRVGAGQHPAGGHVAFHADRTGFVDPARPYLVAIDGAPLDRWLAASAGRGTQGSAAMQARHAERGLRNLGALRAALGLAAGDTVRVTLCATPPAHPDGRTGAEPQTVALPVAARRPLYGTWPRGATRRLDGDIGYLRLASMDSDDAFLDALDEAMQAFRDTRGLVIDVRGNGGGSRAALLRLAPYLLPADRAVVGNVAAVLLEDEAPAPADALADRFLYRADWPGWNERQRAAIADCLKAFRPSWTPPAGRFSPFHFLVLDRADDSAAFAYGRPVAVLIDRGCFSATDVFAAALQAIPGVTVVGEPTSGGSGRARRFRLPASGLELQLSSMASFRPDGVLFEGHGVEPDVPVATRPGDVLGGSDAALAKALELLR